MIYGIKLLQWILSASTCDPVTQFVKSTRPYETWENSTIIVCCIKQRYLKSFYRVHKLNNHKILWDYIRLHSMALSPKDSTLSLYFSKLNMKWWKNVWKSWIAFKITFNNYRSWKDIRKVFEASINICSILLVRKTKTQKTFVWKILL